MQCFATFLPFRAPASSLFDFLHLLSPPFWLSPRPSFFLALLLPSCAFHLSILSEGSLLNFLRQVRIIKEPINSETLYTCNRNHLRSWVSVSCLGQCNFRARSDGSAVQWHCDRGGRKGIVNAGTTCYFASIIQSLRQGRNGAWLTCCFSPSSKLIWSIWFERDLNPCCSLTGNICTLLSIFSQMYGWMDRRIVQTMNLVYQYTSMYRTRW